MNISATVYTAEAKKSGSISLPESIFGVTWNPNLVHDVIVAMDANARTPFAHTKGRGDVRGGGKKPWKQKGTGRARHGSTRSPIWTGGGISFGPVKERDYSQKINKKARHAALKSALSEKMRKNTLLFIDTIAISNPKTKDARKVLNQLATLEGFDVLNSYRRHAALIVTSTNDEVLMKSVRNISNIDVVPAMNLDVRDVMTYRTVVFVNPEESIELLQKRLTPSLRVKGEDVVIK
jgi:large subunit ribosomal protein L4